MRRSAQTAAQEEDAIEAEFGKPLEWKPLPGKKAARILLEAPIDPRDDANRDKVKQWMSAQALAFHKVFHDRVRSLQPPAGSLADESRGD